MRRLLLSLFLLALVLALPGLALAQQNEIVHYVGVGETIESIAALYGVSSFSIAARNGITNFASLYVGQPLVIPLTFDQGGAEVPAAPAAGSSLYIVQPGDSVSVIALRFGTTTAAIAAANGLVNINQIFVGQSLIIPAPFDPGVPSLPAIFYTVQPGDTLRIIAARFGTSIAALAAENNIINVNRIFVGQVLRIPDQGGGFPPPAQYISYVVGYGDTLNEIAVRYGITLQDILDANPQIRNPRLIYPGDVLSILVR